MKKRLPVLADNIRSLKSPHDSSVRTLYVYIALADVPKDLPLSPNPRVPKPNEVIRRVKRSLIDNDGIFHILNRGITISAKSADYDNSTGVLVLDIPEEEKYGILDGGHTYDVVKELAGYPEQADQQYVKFEVLTGVENILDSIASARNFSKAVKAVSLASYSKKLNWLKSALGPVEKSVRWSENDDQPVDALEYIQLIYAFDIDRFTAQVHPVQAYSSTAKCLEAAESDNTLQYLTPVVLDIVKLYDIIRFEWWEKYKSPDEAGRGGRPGRLKEVQDRKRGTSKLLQFPTLPDINLKKAPYHVEKGLVIPLISAFRALVKKDVNGEPYWSVDPFAFWKQNGAMLVRKVMEASDQRGANPQAVGKDKTVYEALYDSVELLYLKSGR
jgi:hypothetical protein